MGQVSVLAPVNQELHFLSRVVVSCALKTASEKLGRFLLCTIIFSLVDFCSLQKMHKPKLETA